MGEKEKVKRAILGFLIGLPAACLPRPAAAADFLPAGKKIEFKLISWSSSTVIGGQRDWKPIAGAEKGMFAADRAIAASEDIDYLELPDPDPKFSDRPLILHFKRRSWDNIWTASQVRATTGFFVDGKLEIMTELRDPLCAEATLTIPPESLSRLLKGLTKAKAKRPAERAEIVRWLESRVKAAPTDWRGRMDLAQRQMDAGGAQDYRKAAVQWEAILDASPPPDPMPIDRINLLSYLRACYQHGGGQARGEARYRKMLESPASPLEEAQLRMLLIEADEQADTNAAALRDLDALEPAARRFSRQTARALREAPRRLGEEEALALACLAMGSR